jgi:hypothetical protein
MFRKSACLAIVVLLSAPALALVKVSSTSFTDVSSITSWPIASTDTTTLDGNLPLYNTGENNYGGAAPYSMAQSWTATKSGNLSHVQIVVSGTPPVSFNINLYDAGVWDNKDKSPSDWSDVADVVKNTYKPGANVSNNLFSSTLAVTWGDSNTPASGVAVLDFNFIGVDMAPITSGHQYIFEITSDTNPNKMVWFRNGSAATNYSAGQAFRWRSPINGNPERDFTLAVTLVSKPTILGMLERSDLSEKQGSF